MKMNPKVKKLWVDALRSGEYKQGTDYLRDKKNRFCCLGVLCNLHAQAHPDIAKKETDPEYYIDSCTSLPYEVQKWAGVADTEFGSLGYIQEMPFSVRATKFGRETFKKHQSTELADLNDGGCNFRQIADVIEAVL